MGKYRNSIGVQVMAACLLLLLAWISLFTGVKNIRFGELFADSEMALFFTISRIPRTLALILVGAGLSISGFVMQQLSQNKFVSPTTSGALEASKMGILVALIALPQASLSVRMAFALVFTFLSSFAFIVFVSKIRLKSTIFIPLIGLMLGAILSAVSTFFAYKHGIVQNTQEWLLGDFSSVLSGQYETVYAILPAVILIYIYAERFTIAGMGESFATNLGISYATVVQIGIFAVSLVVSASVVTVGAVPFLGLIIPNLVSLLVGDNLRGALPLTAFAGASFLLICDIIGRLVVYPYELPIGMTVGIIGSVIFLILIAKRRR